MQLVGCPSCMGLGWFEDEFTGEALDCDWCNGIGYIYRDAKGIDHKIPRADLRKETVSRELEQLENLRLHEMGYSGEAKKPWEQYIRKGTQGGKNPYDKKR